MIGNFEPQNMPMRRSFERVTRGPARCELGLTEDVYSGPTPSPVDVMPPPHVMRQRLGVVPQAQSNGSSCGQASVAMTLTYLTGKNWTDRDVNRHYGFGLAGALNAETRQLGLSWILKDFSAKSWPLIEEKLSLGRPVVMGLNGPKFSPSGRGHIVTLVAVERDHIYFMDPATGTRRCLLKSDFEQAAAYPGGNFYFCPRKTRRV